MNSFRNNYKHVCNFEKQCSTAKVLPQDHAAKNKALRRQSAASWEEEQEAPWQPSVRVTDAWTQRVPERPRTSRDATPLPNRTEEADRFRGLALVFQEELPTNARALSGLPGLANILVAR